MFDPLLMYLRIGVGVAIAIAIFLAPFTKTEESQNMHAIYDLFYKGPHEVERYDHIQFQGVVPRTFVGAKFVEVFLGKTLRFFYGSEDLVDGFAFLVWVRLFLGLCSWFCFLYLDSVIQWLAAGGDEKDWFEEWAKKRAMDKVMNGKGKKKNGSGEESMSGTNGTNGFTNGVHQSAHPTLLVSGGSGGSSSGAAALELDAHMQQSLQEQKNRGIFPGNYYFMGFMLTQFHLIFYCSRSLPNTFALQLCCLALAFWLQRKYKVAIILLTFGSVVFRCELVLFLAAVLLDAFLTVGFGQFMMCIGNILVGSLPAIVLTVFLDSFYWRRTEYSLDLCTLANTSKTLHAATGFATLLTSKIFGKYYYSALGLGFLEKLLSIGERALINTGRQLCYDFDEKSIYGRTLRHFTWPELSVFIFNGPQNRSEEWGVMPKHWYFTNALPKTLGLLLLLVLAEMKFAFLLGARDRIGGGNTNGAASSSSGAKKYGLFQPIVLRTFVFWVLIPVCGLSLIGHKEIRFIFPSILACIVCLSLILQNSYVGMDVARLTAEEEGSSEGNSESSTGSSSRGGSGGKQAKKTNPAKKTPWLLPSAFQYKFVIFLLVLGNIGLAVLRLTASAYNYPAGWAVGSIANWRLIRETHLLRESYGRQRGAAFEHRREIELERDDFVRPVADGGHPTPYVDFFWLSERLQDTLLNEEKWSGKVVVGVGKSLLGMVEGIVPGIHWRFWKRFMELDGLGGKEDGLGGKEGEDVGGQKIPEFRSNFTLQRGTIHGGPVKKKGGDAYMIKDTAYSADRSLAFWQTRRFALYLKSIISTSVMKLDDQKYLLNAHLPEVLKKPTVLLHHYLTVPVRMLNSLDLVESQLRFNMTDVVGSLIKINSPHDSGRLVPADSAGLIKEEWFEEKHKNTTQTLNRLFNPIVDHSKNGKKSSKTWLIPSRIPLHLHLDRFAVNSGVTQYTTRSFVKVTKETLGRNDKGELKEFPDVIITEEELDSWKKDEKKNKEGKDAGKDGKGKDGKEAEKNAVRELLKTGIYVLLQEHTGFSHFDYWRGAMHLKTVLYTYVREVEF